MSTLSPIEFEVLQAVAANDDAENLERVFTLIKSFHSAISLAEIADAIEDLLEKGFLRPRRGGDHANERSSIDTSVVWRDRFEMTPNGRKAWSSANQESIGTSRPTAAPLFGAWKDIAVDIPFEVFKQNRREMWGDSSEDAEG